MLFRSSLLLTVGAVALAAPSTKSPSRPSKRWYPNAVGASYFQTNNFGGNQLVASYIMPDGTLQAGTASWTNGNGSAGINDPDPYMNHPDPFYSSYSVITVRSEVLVVNAGSNTFSVFGIDNADPARPTFKATYPTGEFPISLACSPDYKIVCALTAGADNGFKCYTAGQDGWMYQPSWDRSFGLNLTTPPHGPLGGTPSQMLFASDMSYLYVVIKGQLPTDLNNPSGQMQDGGIWAYALTWEDGMWSLADNYTSVAAPAAFSMNENKYAAGNYFLSDVVGGYDVATLSGGQGTLQNGVVPNDTVSCWNVQSEISHNFYLVGIAGPANITEISVDPTTLNGTVVSSQSLGINASGTDAAIFNSYGVDWMYVDAPGYQSVHAFNITGPGEFNLIQAWDMMQEMPEGLMGDAMSNTVAGQAVYYKC